MIYATAKALSRPIHVYFAVNSHSPLKYSPASIQVDMQSLLLLAFYEPVHYRAVSTLQQEKQLQVLVNCSDLSTLRAGSNNISLTASVSVNLQER